MVAVKKNGVGVAQGCLVEMRESLGAGAGRSKRGT
jgi:hypothetical protein